MGLKHFHFVFIFLAALMSFTIGVSCFYFMGEVQEASLRWLGGFSMVAGVGLSVYGVWFWGQMKHEKYRTHIAQR